MGKAVTLVVKATRLCNLRCVYCHDWRAGPGNTMSFAVLARTIRAALRDPEHDVVTFVWHGGESTLLGPDWFRRAMLVQSRLRRPGQLVRNVIQTNATLIDATWAEFLRESGFHVGVSVDGPRQVHDASRVFVSGEGSYDRVVESIDLLRRQGIEHQVLMVVDEATLVLGADAVFDFLITAGVRRFGINPVAPTNSPRAAPGTPAQHYATPERVGQFLERLYDRWLDHGDTGLRIREFDGLLARLNGQRSGFCRVQGACLGDYYIVEPDGRVAHCDLFLGDPAYEFGDLTQTSFATIRASSQMAVLREQRTAQLQQMQGCPRFDVCRGWCPHEQYLAVRHDAGYDPTCCGMRSLIDHMAVKGGPNPDRRIPIAPSVRA